MALPSSGQIHLGALADNNSSASRANISMKTESERFASGSRVGDIDGDPADLGDDDDRAALRVAPYALSEFHGANYPSSIITGITFTTDGGGGDTDTVDGEDLDVAFTTDGTAGTYTVRLLDSGDNVDASTTRSGAGTVTFSTLALDDANGYKAQVEYNQFNKVNDDATFNHHDLLGSISITDPGTANVAASTTVYAIDHARSITNSNAVNDYNWTFAKSSGDSAGLRLSGEGSYGSSVSTAASTPAIQYKGPGVFTANLRIDGTPSQARNSSTAAEVSHRIEYTDSITANDQSTGANEGATITCVGTHLGIAGGIKIGYVNVSDTGTFLASDTSDSTDSRTVSSGTISKGVTAASLGASTISCKIRAEDRAASSTYDLSDNAFNVYPLISGEFGASDLAISVDPVLVGSNTVLTVANNVTDNVVGYAWSNQGTGTMTSNNASGGDTDGTSADGTSIIDEYSSTTTNTVSFDTAQANKTIRLTLYGRLSQTATADKTLNVELVDATTLNSISAQNGQGAITVSGNQSGFSGGVTFGLVSSSATTTFLSTNSANDTTDSRYTLDAYTGDFTPDDPYGNTAIQHLQARVIDPNDGGGTNKNTSTVTIYPNLTTSKNTINPTTQTIYSTTRNTDTGTYPTSFVFSTPGTRTNNITGRTYSESSSHISISANATPSSQTATQATVQAAGTVDASENVTYTVVGSGASGDQSTATTCAVTINYSKEIYSVSSVSIGGSYDTVNDTLGFSYAWQGFELGSTRYELINQSDDNQDGNDIDATAVTGGNVRTAQGSGTQTLTSQAASFGYSSAGTFKIKISLYSDGGQSTLVASALTAAFETFVVTNLTSAIKGVGLSGAYFGYTSLLLAAENNSSANGTHNRLYSDEVGGGTLYGFNTNVDSIIATDNDLGTAFNPMAAGVTDGTHFHWAGFAIDIGTDGIVDQKVDATPATPASITVTSGSTTATSWNIAVAGETYVSRLVRIYYGTSQGSTSNNVTVNTSEQDASETMTKSSLDVSSFADGNVYFSARFENEAENGSTFAPDIAHAVAADDPSWGSYNATPNANCGIESQDRNCTTVYVTLTNPDSGANEVNATISNVVGLSGVNNLYVAVGTSTNPTNWAAAGVAAQTTAADAADDVIYVRMRVDSNKAGEEDGTFTLTLENGGVSKTDNNLIWAIEGGG